MLNTSIGNGRNNIFRDKQAKDKVLLIFVIAFLENVNKEGRYSAGIYR